MAAPSPSPAPGTDCDVLVVGLGPVGQLLAVLLGGLGVRTIALDAAPAPFDLPRAAVIDDEVLRILQSAGLDAAVLRDAQVQERASYVTAAGRRIDVLAAADGPLGHPPLVSIHQPSLEGTLLRALDGLPSVTVRWAQVVDALEPHADHVAVALRGAAAPLRARWVVACDGGTSPVRTRLGIPFGGSTFAQRWLVVDARVDRPLARVPHPSFVGDPARPIVSLPMSPGRHRWEWMLRPGEPEAPLLDPAAIAALVRPWLDGERVEVERAVVYTFHSRTAARWRAGRVLLAGDAAHVMPPFAGQGFSSGARDAANLAWKLDAVLRGAPEALLDSYEAERRPHVRAMQLLARRWGAVVQTTRPRAARARDAVMGALDGSAAQAWLLDHAKPLPTCRTGAFAVRPKRLPPRRTVGALFPQPWVTDAAGAARRLDDVLPRGWAGVSRFPAATAALRDAGLPVLELGDGARSADAEAWLTARGAGWVLLRPDRYVFALGAPDDVPAAAAELRAILTGPQGPGPAPRGRRRRARRRP